MSALAELSWEVQDDEFDAEFAAAMEEAAQEARASKPLQPPVVRCPWATGLKEIPLSGDSRTAAAAAAARSGAGAEDEPEIEQEEDTRNGANSARLDDSEASEDEETPKPSTNEQMQ